MKTFYGVVKGRSKTAAIRCGTKDSGLEVIAASLEGAIKVTLWHDGEVRVSIEKIEWLGRGKHKIIYEGLMEEKK